MRDLLLAVLLFGGLPVALARPFVGALIFTWLGLMNPHRFTFGIAYDMPWSMMYAVATMVGLVFAGDKRVLDSIRRYWPLVLYAIWMGVTTMTAVESEASYRYQQILKVHVMAVVTLALLTTQTRVIWFLGVLVGSIAFFGIKGGVFTVLGGGENLVWGPPETAITDNNHLAAGLIVVLPLLFWAFSVAPRGWMKVLLALAPILTAISILGSHSRGAFLALCVMGAVLIAKSKHRVVALVAATLVGLAAITIMPTEYWNRIDTINTYEQDASAMGRINTWWTAFNVANDRLTGAGFEYYGSWLYLAHAPNPEAVHSSHSIYFQALGEHGWPGFILYMVFLAVFWKRCAELVKQTRSDSDEAHVHLLARMLQVSLIGFLVAGAFVNIGNWDAIYYAFVVALGMARVLTDRVDTAPRANQSRVAMSTRGVHPMQHVMRR